MARTEARFNRDAEAAGKDLSFPAAWTKDGEAFASKLVCEEKGRGHLGFGRRGRQIDGFETALSLYCRNTGCIRT